MLGGDWREGDLLSAHGLTLLFLSLNCVLFPYASSRLFYAPERHDFFCYIIFILSFFSIHLVSVVFMQLEYNSPAEEKASPEC